MLVLLVIEPRLKSCRLFQRLVEYVKVCNAISGENWEGSG